MGLMNIHLRYCDHCCIINVNYFTMLYVMMPPEIIEIIRAVALWLFLCNYETLEFLCMLDLDSIFGAHARACVYVCVCVLVSLPLMSGFRL